MHIHKGKLFTISNGCEADPTIVSGLCTDARHIAQKSGVLRLTVYKDNVPEEILEGKSHLIIQHLKTVHKLTVNSLWHEA